MSASKQKKLRKEQEEERISAQRKEEQKNKRKSVRNTVIGVIVAVVIIAILVFNSNLFYRHFTAVTVGDESYTAAEMSFFYNSTYNSYVQNYGSMLSYMGLDTSKPLKSQSYGEGQSWADYFKEMAVDQMQSVTTLWKEAQKEGFVLSDEQQAELQALISSLDTVHEGTGVSNKRYFSAVYGKGVTKEIAAEMMERSYIANCFSQFKGESFTYTPEELESRYEENKDNYDIYEYMSVTVSGAADEENGIDEETAMAEAKKKAEAIVKGVKSEAAFIKNAKTEADNDPTPQTKSGSSLPSDIADWMKDASRKEGDTTAIEGSTSYTAVYFISRDDNDYATENVRHILVKAEADENGEYTDEAKETARLKAEDILNEWKTGEATEESFAALEEQYSEDKDSSTGALNSDGIYENVPQGRMVQEFNDWIYDSSRKTGDTGIVFNEDSNYCGYHVMYFVGDGENYRNILADTDMRSSDYQSWYDAALANYPITMGFTAWFVGR